MKVIILIFITTLQTVYAQNFHEKNFEKTSVKELKENVIEAIHSRKLTIINDFVRTDSPYLFEYICEAVYDGSLDIVKTLHKKNININLDQNCPKKWSETGKGLMFISSLYGYEDIVDYLIDKNVDLNITKKSLRNLTPLDIALVNGNSNIAKKLLENNATISKGSRRTLEKASYSDHNFEILKNLYIDKNSICKAIENAFVNAALKNFQYLIQHDNMCNGNFNNIPSDAKKFIKSMLDNGIDISSIMKSINSYSLSKNFDIMNFLIKEGLNLENAVDSDGNKFPSIMYKADYNVLKIVLQNLDNPYQKIKEQLKQGKELPFQYPKNLELLLTYIVENSNYKQDFQESLNNGLLSSSTYPNHLSATLFLRAGANINTKSMEFSPLLKALNYRPDAEGKSAYIKMLLENGADVNITGYKGKSALHFLLSNHYKNNEILKILLDYKIDVNKQDEDGRYPIQLAVEEENFAAIELLLKHGAIINKQIFKNVIQHNQMDIFKILLDTNFSIPLEDILVLTTEFGSYNMTKLLLNKSVKIDIHTSNGKNIIINAYNNKLDFLVESITIDDWNTIIDEEGNTLLHHAVLQQDIDEVEVFAKKVNINQTNNKGVAPLHLAIQNRNIPIISRDLYDDYVRESNRIYHEGIKSYLDKNMTEKVVHTIPSKNYLKIIKKLLFYQKINVNLEDKELRTPLYLALKYSNSNIFDVASLLLEYGARIDKKSYQLIENISDEKLLQLFQKYGYKKSEKTSEIKNKNTNNMSNQKSEPEYKIPNWLKDFDD